MEVVTAILNLGPSVIMPIILTIMGLFFRLTLYDSFRSGLMIGIGFIGVTVITNMLSENINTVVSGIADRFHLNLNIIDLGWPVAANIAFHSLTGMLMLPICLLVNSIMIYAKLTRTINIDLWNYWHFAFTSVFVSYVTQSAVLGILAGILDFMLTMIMADLTAPSVKKYYQLPNISFPNAYSLMFIPIAVFLNQLITIMTRPFKKKRRRISLSFSIDPIFVGLLLGLALGLLANFTMYETAKLSVVFASMMLLIPKVSSILVDGIRPISNKLEEKILQQKDKNLFIGMTPSLVINDKNLLISSGLLIPIIILLSLFTENNQFLPIASLSGLIYLVPLIISITNGSIIRTVVIGSIILVISNYLISKTAEVFTALAKSTNIAIPSDSLVSSLDYGSSPLVYFLTEANLSSYFFLFLGIYIIGFIMLFFPERQTKWNKEKKRKVS
ncbi:PTS transporter subunit IIC [Niallia sp. NCCP-28]|uniref:PTS transporter subunit IIC n=1 Tax=Niallia sp. NCCP-28 TaxID=2934712 RepID=UPI00208104BF|nr:PTS transporter subunit IIC [Niallia sp. NCCP-28]GKU81935.1 PTS sugar transporter subunit IIC [Niallia sp. NCCP-28]